MANEVRCGKVEKKGILFFRPLLVFIEKANRMIGEGIGRVEGAVRRRL